MARLEYIRLPLGRCDVEEGAVVFTQQTVIDPRTRLKMLVIPERVPQLLLRTRDSKPNIHLKSKSSQKEAGQSMVNGHVGQWPELQRNTYRQLYFRNRLEKGMMTEMYLYRLFITFLLVCSGSAYAQFAPPAGGCPPGMHLEGFSCVYDRQPADSQPPAPRWVTRWGAIAVGSTASGGGFGVSTNMKSKRKAEATAIKQCKSTGGGPTCRTALVYHDQCAVVAWGAQSFTVQGAESIEIASELAMRDCNTRTEDCQVFYSGCSYPERIQ